MRLSGPAAPPHRSVLEFLAEARARTLLIVSPLSDEEMRRQPDPAVDPVLTRLTRIVQFEQRWLLDDRTGLDPQTYDEWFDLMMDVRQRLLDQPEPLEHYRVVVEYEYRQNEAIFETIQ